MKSALALLLVVGLAYVNAVPLPLDVQEAGHVSFANTAGPANAQWTVKVDRNPPTSVVVCVSWLTPLDDPPVADLTSIWKRTCSRANSTFFECNTTDPCDLKVAPQAGDVYVNVFNTGGKTTADITKTAESCNCGTPIVLKPGAPVSVTSQQRANYIASVSTVTWYLESATFTFTGGDGTAYFALASYPTEDIYDFKCDFGTADNTDCVLANPAFNSVANGDDSYGWIIFVDSQDDITVTVAEKFSGATSALQLNVSDAGEYYIPNDVDLHQVFYIDNAGTEALDIIVAGLDGYEQLDVAPDVWVQLDSFPSSERFLVAASGAQANRISIDITGIATAESVWYVEIDNTKDIYAYGIWTPSNDTYLCPGEPLCGGSAHGTCDELTYVCNCTKSYDGLACDHEIKNFETEYIILIAVGGLLVLSIVIGVPIYCWMNMRKDYEMVD